MMKNINIYNLGLKFIEEAEFIMIEIHQPGNKLNSLSNA